MSDEEKIKAALLEIEKYYRNPKMTDGQDKWCPGQCLERIERILKDEKE